MQNCNSDIKGYHSEEVKLTAEQKNELRGWRNANRNRLRRGLEKAESPEPKKSVAQGSFVMGTTIQEPGNKYDIDDGVVFTKESLRGPRGGDMEAVDARNMVCDALHDDKFKKPPKIKPNCVRVFYNEGPHVDIPVYRSEGDDYELASADWKESDPEGVNEWFRACVESKKSLGLKHFRELIRLIKSMCKNRTSLSLPSGFVITVLVDECYFIGDDRLDIDLYKMIGLLRNRLAGDLHVKHPVVDGEFLIDSDNDNKTTALKEVLDKAAEKLECLELQTCTYLRALKAWKGVFNNTDYFNDKIAEEEAKTKTRAAGLIPAVEPYNPKNHGDNETRSG